MIPFNSPFMTGNELDYIAQAHRNAKFAGDGPFTKRCHEWLEQHLSVPQALLTHSCTAALEMTALLTEIGPGDEVIMPSFTFVSTANAFVLRGGVPVFVDVRPDTLNINEDLIETAITAKTKAIVVVHYAGVACEMDRIHAIARKYGLWLIEDAAHAILSRYRGKALGSLSDLACLSFHETKNIIAGEGGALLVNRHEWRVRAEIIREKGTDRSQFFRGQVDKYSWRAVGSSFLPGELTASFLLAQMEQAESITRKRLDIWQQYHEALLPEESIGTVRRPVVPEGCEHNGHMYYLIASSARHQKRLIQGMLERGIQAVTHYVPLHQSEAGQRFGKCPDPLPHTEDVAKRLLRLPLWIGVNTAAVIDAIKQVLRV